MDKNKNGKGAQGAELPTQEKKPATNGTTVSIPEKSTLVVLEKREEAAKLNNVPETEKPKPTVRDIIERSEKLNRLIEKREKIADRRDEIEAFGNVADSNSIYFEIHDNHGNRFNSSHSGFVAQVLDLAKNTADSELQKVDAEILNY